MQQEIHYLTPVDKCQEVPAHYLPKQQFCRLGQKQSIEEINKRREIQAGKNPFLGKNTLMK
jgi:hypothetical protein